ncbi:MAG: GGDEF domain-containing protein [Gammaproteobacteria bacterium]|nr:GGDEF domain-containing protein [Gammaproteobacteria bacterium]
MSQKIFSYEVIVEPDLQRLSRLILEAVSDFAGDMFKSTRNLIPIIDHIRHRLHENNGAQKIALLLDGNQLLVKYGLQEDPLSRLYEAPATSKVTDVALRLKQACEIADPDLLTHRNKKISKELADYMRQAADQIHDMESVLENKKEELKESLRVAETDSLTGLLNRGGYDDRLREAVLRSSRQGEALSLIMIDVDEFKEVNDSHGHQYGDEHLRKVAECMVTVARQDVDFSCRIGGDEFAIVAFCDVGVARKMAERVLDCMGGGLSLGVSQMKPDDDIDTLIAQADEALYAAKRNGRSQVVVAPFVTLSEQA